MGCGAFCRSGGLLADRIKRMSDKGREWLVGLEGGVRRKAYRDSRGVWTIGVGQTTISVWGKVRRVQQGDEFPDNSTALRAFYLRLAQDEAAVDAVTRDDITQAEFDAFCAARYNIGPAFDRATFLKLFNERAPIKLVADSLRANYHRAGDQPHALDERRACESDLLRLGVYRLQGQKLGAA